MGGRGENSGGEATGGCDWRCGGVDFTGHVRGRAAGAGGAGETFCAGGAAEFSRGGDVRSELVRGARWGYGRAGRVEPGTIGPSGGPDCVAGGARAVFV